LKINPLLSKTQIENKHFLYLETRKSLNLHQSNLRLSHNSENNGTLEIEFKNLFQDFKFSKMKFVIFRPPYNFEVRKVSEYIQMELLALQYDCSQRKI
jgi:tRNA1(Val) A37 N6-methylase TrmN6